MKLTGQLAERLKEVLTQGKWVTGTNFKSQILNIDWQTATTKIAPLNSIADITFHVDYYIAGVLHVFEGGQLEIKDKYSFNAPAIDSPKAWENLTGKFCADSENFIKTVEKMSEQDLQKTFVLEKYGSFHRNIDVIIEHAYYHLGQVILIKKLIRSKA
ncbi:MAG: DUF1572 family protein [Candidatus Cyclobacteriaceae bacterium M3_2C_046]